MKRKDPCGPKRIRSSLLWSFNEEHEPQTCLLVSSHNLSQIRCFQPCLPSLRARASKDPEVRKEGDALLWLCLMGSLHTQQRLLARGLSHPTQRLPSQEQRLFVFFPNHHQNSNKLLTRTNLKISVSSTSHSAPLLYLSPILALPSACPHSSFLPGMMETVSFSQDTTLTYSCTEEGMRHLKTATFPRIDL